MTSLSQVEIKGIVVDKQTQKPIRFVIISDALSSNISETDTNGNFTISISSTENSIIFSRIGYKTLQLKGIENLKRIELEPHISELKQINVKVKEETGEEIMQNVIANLEKNYHHDNVLYTSFYRVSKIEREKQKSEYEIEIISNVLSSPSKNFKYEVKNLRLKNQYGIKVEKYKKEYASLFIMKFYNKRTYNLPKYGAYTSSNKDNFLKKGRYKTYTITKNNTWKYNNYLVHELKLESKKTGNIYYLYIDSNDYGIHKIKYSETSEIFFVKEDGKYYVNGLRSETSQSITLHVMIDKKIVDSNYPFNSNLITTEGYKYGDFMSDWDDEYWDDYDYKELDKLLK